MAETPVETVNRVFRENKRYTDDGLPSPPTGAPLPVGDPASGVWNPKKADLRQALLAPLTVLDGVITEATEQAVRAETAAGESEADADRAQTYAAMLSVDRIKFNTVPALIADESMGYVDDDPTPAIIVGPGDIIEAQGFRYEVAAGDATDEHVETAGGVKLYALPDRAGVVSTVQMGALGGASNSATDQQKFAAGIAITGKLFIHPLPGDDADTSYYHLNSFSVPSGAELFGAGDTSKIKFLAGDKGDNNANSLGAITTDGSTHFYLHDFLVDGNKSNVTATNLFNLECIALDNCEDFLAERVTTVNAKSDGFDMDYAVRGVIRNCVGIDCGGWAVHQSLESDLVWTDGCKAFNCGHDLERGGFDVFETATRGRITNCETYDCYRGVVIHGAGSQAIGCRIYNSTDSGLRVEGNNCEAVANHIDGVEEFACIQINGNRNTVNGNTCLNANGSGISVGGSAVANGNTVSGNTITGCSINTTSAALGVGVNSTGNVVTGNNVSASQNNGLEIGCDNSNNLITDNWTGSDASIGMTTLIKKNNAGTASVGDIIDAANMSISSTGTTGASAPAGSVWRWLGPVGGVDGIAMARRVR